MTVRFERIENVVIAAAVLLGFVIAGWPWWVLFAAFLVFDLSALGYLRGNQVGALTYNAVHNYTGPAILAVLYIGLAVNDLDARVWGVVAGCWAFHVAVDRGLGYGLKTAEGFGHTHLGMIGKNTKQPNGA